MLDRESLTAPFVLVLRFVVGGVWGSFAAGMAGPKPFMLLLPAWTASKAGWRQFLHTLAMIRNGNTSATLEDAAASRLGNDLEERAGVCYVCPGEKYEFIAAGAARDTAPFFGIWFCGGLDYGAAGGQSGTARAVELVDKAQASRGKSRGEGYKLSSVKTSLAALQDAGLVRTSAEEKERLLSDPAMKARRDVAIAELNAKRKADPAVRARKNQKKKEARLRNAAVCLRTTASCCRRLLLLAAVAATRASPARALPARSRA